jgi:hypothetical protein
MGRVARLRTVLALALVMLLGMAYAAWRHLDSPSPGVASPSAGAPDANTATPGVRDVRSSGPVTLSEKEIDTILAAVAPARPDLFYELTVDRFANGDPSNDEGGRTGGPEKTGFDPTRADYFHGGDLAGVMARLDYLAELGVTTIVLGAIWAAPTDSPPRLTVDVVGAEAIDPRYGTEEDLRALVSAAHERTLRVVLDVVLDGEPATAVTANRWLDTGIDGFRIRPADALFRQPQRAQMSWWSVAASQWRSYAAAHLGQSVSVYADTGPEKVGTPRALVRASGLVPLSNDWTDWAVDRFGGELPAEGFPDAATVIPWWGLTVDEGRLNEPAKAGLVERLKLALGDLFLLGGQPMIPAGIEQGLTRVDAGNGWPRDQFATRMPAFAKAVVVGGAAGARDRYDVTHPVAAYVAELAALRAANPALVSGSQRELFRGVDDQEVGIGVVSRIDPDTGVEYLVVRNPGQDRRVSIVAETPGASFTPIFGSAVSEPVVTDATGEGAVKVSLDKVGVSVLKADRPVPSTIPVTVQVSARPASFAQVAMPVAAEVTGPVAALAFAVRPAGTSDWRVVPGGSHAPYVSMVSTPEAPGTELELVAVARAVRGNVVVSSTKATQGRAVSPDEVFTAIGDFQKEVGCAYDDQPDCARTRLTDPDGDGTFTWTSPKLTGGSYQVSVAANVAGTETFGAGGYPGADGESVGWFDAGPLPLTISFTPATGALGIDLPF